MRMEAARPRIDLDDRMDPRPLQTSAHPMTKYPCAAGSERYRRWPRNAGTRSKDKCYLEQRSGEIMLNLPFFHVRVQIKMAFHSLLPAMHGRATHAMRQVANG